MTAQISWTLDYLVEKYKHHQRRIRGLREKTLQDYERFVRPFVRVALGGDPFNPARLSPSDVVAFISYMSERFSPRSMKHVRTALRSFFRFLRVEGLCDERMESVIPTVAHWRLSTLPRSLSDSQLEQVLTSFDTSTPCGHRDRAIVLCLASLGLRPGELAELRLEDFDWRRGTIELRTRKTRRGAILPLPEQAGRAIVAYLRHHRPPTDERRVFVKHVGHHRGEPISSHTISVLVGRVLGRAGVAAPMAGAYVFRHTVAGRLVRQETSLKEVADFLGHRSLDTTAIYAKLDLPALREVALPWPKVLQ
jgi:site-specific recombinase XerD